MQTGVEEQAQSSTQGVSSKGGAIPDVSQAYAHYVLGVLFVVTIFNYIDRQILSILLQPIKDDLKISDTALGFLTGFAFAIFYTIAGIPLARIADRWSRRSLIAISLAVWSLMTALSGLARGFTDLALARIASVSVKRALHRRDTRCYQITFRLRNGRLLSPFMRVGCTSASVWGSGWVDGLTMPLVGVRRFLLSVCQVW
jgi:MFS family permease